MKWTVKEPVYGDMIRTKVHFYYHYGIFVSDSQVIQFGLPDDPLRSSDQIQVLSTDVSAFLYGSDLEVAVMGKTERKQMFSPREIVQRAQQRLGEGGYNILHNNCEHFAYDCVFGKPTSTFLQGVREDLRKKLKKI